LSEIYNKKGGKVGRTVVIGIINIVDVSFAISKKMIIFAIK